MIGNLIYSREIWSAILNVYFEFWSSTIQPFPSTQILDCVIVRDNGNSLEQTFVKRDILFQAIDSFIVLKSIFVDQPLFKQF